MTAERSASTQVKNRPAVATKTAANGANRKSFSWRSPRAILIVILIAFVALWELATRLGVLDPSFFPAPSMIVAAVPGMVGQAAVGEAMAQTGLAMLYAAGAGIAAGIVMGYLMGFFRVIRDAFMGPALYLLSVPKSIFIPIFMLVFGIKLETAVIYGIFSGFIYVMVNVVGGFDLIEQRHLTIGRAFGAGKMARIVHIIMPASLPGLFTGIWYGLKSGVEAILIFELFLSVTGLGRLLNAYSNDLRTAEVFAIVLFFSIIAIVLGSIWSRVERRLTRWRPQAVSSSRRTVAAT